jgi:hypothetical protein
VLVALDSSITDLLLGSSLRRDGAPTSLAGWWTPEHTDAMEALQEPPPFVSRGNAKRRRELWACFWLRALHSSWPSVLYTFSDMLYTENEAAKSWNVERARALIGFAVDVREYHPPEARTVDALEAPSIDDVLACGVIGSKDARHVSDAIGMQCSTLLTNDRPLRARAGAIYLRWGLRVRLPSEFLVESVRAGAPWPCDVPPPWEPRKGLG